MMIMILVYFTVKLVLPNYKDSFAILGLNDDLSSIP